MTKNELGNMFYYRDGKLFNKVTRNSRALKDSVVGTKHHSGYYQTQIDNKLYMVHRLIWILHYDTIEDGMEIDHLQSR